jgi:ubiquinone/menaquinone biosynthesis C-methylase UbiE
MKTQGKRFKGKVGEEYELFKLACPHFDKLQKSVKDAIKAHFAKRSEITVLELGCGSGYTTEFILKAKPNIKVIAVDNEKVMIAQAKKNLAPAIKKGKVRLVLKDALSFLKTVNNNSIDAFASAFVLHNWKQEYRKEVLEEIHRILRKGGLFVNADKYMPDSKKEYMKGHAWQINQFEVFVKEGRPDLKKSWTVHYLEDDKPNIRMVESAAVAQMKKIGFKDIKKTFRRFLEATIIATK